MQNLSLRNASALSLTTHPFKSVTLMLDSFPQQSKRKRKKLNKKKRTQNKNNITI